MTNNNDKGSENQSKEEQLKAINKMIDKYLENANGDEKAELMMNFMPKMMGNGMSMMKNMCHQMMGSNMFSQNKNNVHKENSGSCCEEKNDTIFETQEIKSIFEEWVSQVQQEISNYLKTNNSVNKKEIARHFKISEESLEYFMKGIKKDVSSCCCSSSCCDESINNTESTEYEVVKIKKTNNVCQMCEDYAEKQSNKPIVIMSCEGACLRGEVSRRSANIICYTLAQDKTARLCLGGAFTKEGGQRNLARNAKRVIALEGCFIKCASRMIKGVVGDVEPEIIVTDKLFNFDTKLFEINEMPDELIQANSLEVAKKIAEKL